MNINPMDPDQWDCDDLCQDWFQEERFYEQITEQVSKGEYMTKFEEFIEPHIAAQIALMNQWLTAENKGTSP